MAGWTKDQILGAGGIPITYQKEHQDSKLRKLTILVDQSDQSIVAHTLSSATSPASVEIIEDLKLLVLETTWQWQ